MNSSAEDDHPEEDTLIGIPEQQEQARAASSDANLDLPGYLPQRLLGAGAFGEVWAALQERTGQTVAIKVLSRRDGHNWKLFQKELESLGRVAEHPFIVTLVDADLEHSPPYLVMPLLSQGSLAELASDPDNLPPVAQVVEWFEQVATALQYVHRKGILHCDLKPANILIDDEGMARVADFGQAHLIGEQELSLGTLWYMSPEQAEALESPSAANPDVGWDVYALGATIYRLLIGKPPRATTEGQLALSECEDITGRLRAYRHEVSTRPLDPLHHRNPKVDPELSTVVEGCLKVDPDDRFPDMGAILNELKNRKQRASSEEAWLGLLRSGCEAGALVSIIGLLVLGRMSPYLVGGASILVGLWLAHRFGLLDFVSRVADNQVTDRRSPLFFAVGALALVCFLAMLLQEYLTTGGYVSSQQFTGSDSFGRIAFLTRYFVAGFVVSLFLLVLSPGYDQRTSFSWNRLQAAALLLVVCGLMLLLTWPY